MTNKTTYRQTINRIRKQIEFLNQHDLSIISFADLENIKTEIGKIQLKIMYELGYGKEENV